MNRTNLFQELTNANGTFIQFQNYADDMCKQVANFEGWRVIPNKYMLVNIPEILTSGEEFDAAMSTNSKYEYKTASNTTPVDAKSIIAPFQNYFENSIAYIKENIGEMNTSNRLSERPSIEYSDEVVKSVFWQTMERFGLLGKTGQNFYDQTTFENVNYIGDINIISSKDYAGSTNTEIYIYVPEDAKRTKYSFYMDKLEMCCGKYDGEMIYGWDENSLPLNATLDSKPMLSRCGGLNIYGEPEYVSFGGYTTVMPEMDSLSDNYYGITADEQNDVSFEFNAIVLFYDIEYNNDGVIEKKHTGVPMGIYFLGTPNTEGQFSGSIKKFVSNDEIYGQGTAYSMRLCTKYLALPNINKLTVTCEQSDDSLDDYTSVMNEFGKSQKIMTEIIKQQQETHNLFNDEFSRFKNYRTNVPYVKQVGDHKEWFVNGRATGVICLDESLVERLNEKIMAQNAVIENLKKEINEMKQHWYLGNDTDD